ncbi:MAG: DUF4159 domain-containing protein [Planctomycetaceae bacterium]|nr:DUF4159 domain-containing protein [Planctomycetaceae bacterium]
MKQPLNKCVMVLLATLLAAPAAPAAAAVSSDDVRQAVAAGVAELKQTLAGGNPRRARGGRRGGGVDGGIVALCTLAVLNAGVPANDPVVADALDDLAASPNDRTYVVSLKAQCFAASGLEKYKPALRAAAQWLIAAQLNTGMWSYTHQGRGDNSNTQFALLGLHEAAKAGVAVPQGVWQKATRHWTVAQSNDGGWGYQAREGGYGSMTAAGLASMFICGQRLNVGGPKVFVNGAYPDCGRYQQNQAIAAGLRWMQQNFSVAGNPKRGDGWHLYYMYGMERVGMISGLRNLGTHDWYREGAAWLVAHQNKGNWGQTYDTAFAVLFLAKGNRPVLFQKLKWDGQWNRNIHDLENLTGFIGDKLGKAVTWQTASLDMSLKELLVSPITVITGHEFPKFTDAQKKLLRQYVENGGTLLFEACCGSKAFDAGFREFSHEVFPEYPLKPLEASHPVFRSYYELKDKDMYSLEGIDVGCRTGVFYSPNALSCLWEMQSIPEYSPRAFHLGTNIAAYATGREALADKLDEVELAAAARKDKAFEIPRGAVRIARLQHNGEYNADANAIVHLTAALRDQAKVDVVSQARHLKADDPKLFEYPVIFMTGHYSFELPDREIENLRLYLTRGGILIADACCGQPAFDESFRKLAAKLFPQSKLEAIAADHPVVDGRIGAKLGELKYRKLLADELKTRGTMLPPLEILRVDGKPAIIYSKYDWSCALEGDKPYSCRGYDDESGKKLAMNIFLYAISY